MRALNKTFEALYQISDAMASINPQGKTDPAIFREMLHVHFGRPPHGSELDTIGHTYLGYLEKEMKNSTQKKVLNGVKEFLDHLQTRNDIAVALGTGNLEKGARMKLDPLHLNSYFSVGGFGSDAESRPDVLKHGHRRAELKWAATIPESSVFVIGDTPLDVAAARQARFKSVAVASGGVSLEDLEKSKPDYLWKNMNEGFEFLETWDC